MPAGEAPGIDRFKELLRHAAEKHPLGQAAPNAVEGKRKRDGDSNGEYTALAAKRTKGDSDGRCPAPAANKVHIIDFGMAKRYKDPKTQEHIPHRENISPEGTPRYMSINAHLGQEQSRRDDLEALCYVSLYFLMGSLPWQGIKAPKRHEQIREKKQGTTIEVLCTGFPMEFAECLRYDDEPDYGYPQNLFSRVLEGAGEVDDGKFDWLKAREERPRLKIRPPRTSDSAATPSKRTNRYFFAIGYWT